MAHLTHRRQRKARVRERRSAEAFRESLARILLRLLGNPDSVFAMPNNCEIVLVGPTVCECIKKANNEISKAILGEELTKP